MLRKLLCRIFGHKQPWVRILRCEVCPRCRKIMMQYPILVYPTSKNRRL